MAAAVLGGTLAADPQPAPTPLTWIDASITSDHLSNGSPDWAAESITAATRTGRKALYAAVGRSERFGVSDPQYVFGGYFTPSAQTIANLEFATSPTHRNLPVVEFTASLDHRLARGWGYQLGLRQRTFTAANVSGPSFGVDRYWGANHAAYTLTGTRVSTVPGIVLGHALSLTHYYGSDELSSFGAFAATGREAENIAGAVIVSTVTSGGLNGVHWFERARTALTWSAALTQQGRFYTRSEIRIGVRRRL
jgi:YaiO family outer membrane protein